MTSHDHGQQRLPDMAPEPKEEEPAAPEAVRNILASPSYREADQDVDFLGGSEARGLRLQLDYLKTETLLERNNVAHTIAVFGGTRIIEPEAARRHLAACAAVLAASPADGTAQRRHREAQSLLEKSRYYDIARELGRLVGAAGCGCRDCRIMIVTGGGPGIMEAANRGAHDIGAPSIGLNITLPHAQYPNPYITPDLSFRFHYFAVRKMHFLLRTRALIAFPGGFGTLDEVFEVLTLAQTGKMQPVPVILVGEAYWRRVFDPEFLVAEGMIDAEDRELFWFRETAADIWNDILNWYEVRGRPLLAPPPAAPTHPCDF